MKKILILLFLFLFVSFGYLFLIGQKVKKPIAGGVIPHHLLADFIIIDFFKRLSIQKPQTIILIGPNHFEKGGKILSCLENFKTNNGEVEINSKMVETLQKDKLAEISEEIVKSETSISDIVPIIKSYFPNALIVPIILRQNSSMEQLEILSDRLSIILDEKTILIASIDFSHYLSSEEAEIKDSETIETIFRFDIGKILTYGNDNLDSPASMAVTLLAMKNKNHTAIEIFHHTNSGEIIRNGRPPTTSYFSLAFY